MNIESREEKNITVMKISGRLDATVYQDLDKAVTQKIAEGKSRIVLDFSDLTYISSAGLRSLLTSTKKLKAVNGTLALCAVRGMVKDVIALSGFDTFLTISDTIEQALND